MIVKELEQFTSEDKKRKAGRAAEENVAFYLKRFYQDDPTIHVLNNIRIQTDEGAAQVDHLIIHKSGFIVIECKSVHGTLQLKEDGQWVRWYGKTSQGVGSPIIQAEMQIDFFRKFLNSKVNKTEIFNKIPFKIIVAISNEGQFLRPKNNNNAAPEVCKMDQLKEKIESIRKEETSQFLSDKEINTVSDFLKIYHKPSTKNQLDLKVEEVKIIYEVKPNNVCKHCGSNDLKITYGKNYYFHCLKCNKNTAINNKCPTCNRTEKIHGKKKDFFTECEHCKTSKLFHRNA